MLGGVDLNGVILLSQILSFDNSADSPDGNPGTDQPYYLALPSMAATAWYHHRLANQPADLEAFLRTVEQFSLGEYASALLQGLLHASTAQALPGPLTATWSTAEPTAKVAAIRQPGASGGADAVAGGAVPAGPTSLTRV